MLVLILSRTENVHADAIEKYCSEHSEVGRINFDFESLPDGEFPKLSLGSEFETKIPNAVFVHHPRVSYRPEWFSNEIERRLFVASWGSAEEWLEAQFTETRWINRPSATTVSRNILLQLRLAQSLGFKTPNTLFTNDLEKLLAFSADGVVVIKQGNLGVNLNGKRILTTVIDPSLLKEDELIGSPCLFQRYVPKSHELRVHVVGDRVLTCRIDSQLNENTRIDWRNYDLDNTPHHSFDLPKQVSDKCVELTKRLGLTFGVIDLIVTPDEQYVFLECNAQGHWIWIEELTGLPITKTLGEKLLNGLAL